MLTDDELATIQRINDGFDAMNHENPSVALSYEGWLLFAAHLPREDDIVGRNPVSPYQVMELERNAARSENKALKLQLQQLHQQANAVIQQLQQQHQQQTIFLAAIIHSHDCTLDVPHASLDAIRKTPHKFDETVDNDLKLTRITVTPLTDEEVAALRQPPAASDEPSDPTEPETIERPKLVIASR